MKKALIYNMSLARGGAERVTVYLAEYLARNGVACDIITERVYDHEYDVPNGVNRICLSRGNYFSKVHELRKLIKQSGADVLLVMAVPNCIYASLAALGLKIRVVVSERNDPANFLGKPAVKHLSRFLMKFAHGFVFQTNDAKAYYAKKLSGRGTVIPNPLFTDSLPPAYEGEREKNIVSAGRLVPQKNQKMLIDAFSIFSKDHPDFSLTIYGEGALRGALETQARELGLDGKVFLPGNVSDLLQRTKSSAAFVMSSDFEGMPNALIEAMAIGLPCISTDCPCGGPGELINNGENGLLVPVGDTAALSDALKKLVDNPQLSEKIQKNAPSIRERLDSDLIGKAWLDYLENT